MYRKARRRGTAALSALQQGLQRINPKFKMKIQSLPRASISDKLNNREKPASPLTYMGWGPDYSDRIVVRSGQQPIIFHRLDSSVACSATGIVG